MSPDTPIYMDCHATTPVDQRVLDAMLPYLTRSFGNASSRTHRFGREAGDAVEVARDQTAAVMGARPKEIIFTSGATESCNLAIRGIMSAQDEKKRHIITQQTEHHAVLNTCRRLEQFGYDLTVLPVDCRGRLEPKAVADAISDQTGLVSVMAAGNEVGVLQPLEEIGRVCRDHGIVFHTDATQIVGKLDLNVTEAGIDLLSLSAHKFYGPKGVGALFIRDGLQTRPRAFMDGGGQERGLRPGTLNVPGIVGLGMACEIATAEWRTESGRVAGLRDRLQGLLFDTIPDTHLNGPSEKRLPGNLNVSFGGIDGEGLLMAVDDVALSSGSACTSAALEPSYVLKALGLSVRRIQGSIRFGLGRFNTGQEVDYVADRVTKEVGRLRDLSPTYRREKSDGATPEQRSTDARES